MQRLTEELIEVTRFLARAGQVAYGYPIGMLCAEWHIPFIPGDLNNAGTFDFPIRYQSVKGVSGAAVLSGTGGEFAAAMGQAAQQLEAEGVRAITGNCGFMAAFQEHVAAQVDIPVFLSSLLQGPMITSMLSKDRVLGILTANSAGMTPELLGSAGLADMSRVAVQGLEDASHFHDVILKETGELDDELMRAEVVQGALQLIENRPDVGAFLLECSDLPPYAQAIHEATGLPVFDWANFINYVHRSVVPQTYNGIF